MKHVLVVEDDAVNALVFRRVLEKRGPFRVTMTENGDEVLERVRSGDVDLVVMDVSLRRTLVKGRQVNGVELCRQLKGDPQSASIPVLLATAHAMRGDAESLVTESGADGYVAKPIVDHEGFIRQIAGMLKEAA